MQESTAFERMRMAHLIGQVDVWGLSVLLRIANSDLDSLARSSTANV